MEMKKFLEQLGFTNFTGNLWQHEKFGIMAFEENTTQKEIVEAIYKRGWNECQAMIRASLGIVAQNMRNKN